MNFSTTISIALIIIIQYPVAAQKSDQLNLVPNPGFEKFSDEPSGWYYSGKDFSRVALYWTSATAASPDLYAPKVVVPESWKPAGFGSTKSYEGKSHAGITVYGCYNGKPHCREYIEVQLTEPLVTGQRYAFTCMLSQLQKSVTVKNIQLAFSKDEIDERTNEPLFLKPALSLDRWIPSDGKWYRWTGQFVASDASSFLLIGNFNSDADSQIKMPSRSNIRFGYYYIDLVRLFKIPPILNTPASESPLSTFIPKAGEIVTLSRIYFEYDRTDFMPQALIQLKQLLAFIKQHPGMRLEVIGHTDIAGTITYNQDLSERRSGAVVKWLISKGIKRDRLKSSGKGSSIPLSTNETAIGRSLNRRVEIKVLSL